ncbi:hypothetical protein [Bacillus sp. REN3]|uniref:hypothetical protein n=1 Tax=Bacillus sp. REN3 TaxID=2802440 RepID=UPI001AEE3F54|nr:hypothetical protein [Bacillus sp. REN3]
MGPAYHPDWLVTFWLTTPVLKWINPHYLLILIGAGLVAVFFLKKRRGQEIRVEDNEDQRFKHLLLKKNVIEEQLAGLEGKFMDAEITELDYARKRHDYEQHLDQVMKELQQYTL